MIELPIHIALAAILVYVILDDFRNLRIRNEAVAALIVLYVLKEAIGGRYGEAVSHAAFAAVLFVLLLLFYARNLLGGGDVKLLVAAFLWLGIENSFLFSLLLLTFSVLYWLLAMLGAVSKRKVTARTRIPFGPSIAAAWLTTLIILYSQLQQAIATGAT